MLKGREYNRLQSTLFTKYAEFHKKLNGPEHKFLQDIKTRWNSQYYMFSRIEEQKTMISFCSGHSKFVDGYM